MLKTVQKRDGSLEPYKKEKITWAILNAAAQFGGNDYQTASNLADEVESYLVENFQSSSPDIETIQDTVERVLIKNGHAKTAKAYILYRDKRSKSREFTHLIGETIDLFHNYLGDKDWRINENSNTQKSINGLNNYVREIFTQKYWLHEIYTEEIRQCHENGDAHIHDLGFFGPYCAGWDLRLLLMHGFGGVPGKVESAPAKHMRAFLGQVVNSTFTTQGETAGAQAWSSFDTYLAPFIRYDNMDYKAVKQCLQEFVFNINVPTRVGFQCPFSNLTFDIKVPKTLANEPVILGGVPQEETYGDFQAEMDILNKAFCDVMLEGDSHGRVFTFPIPTINITKDFDWDNEVVDAFMEITCKYGIPYFANYVNSDLSPEDAVSMCCRLRLDTRELKKRGGGLFGSNPLTGSIGVFTINLPRIGYLSKSVEEFKARLWKIVHIGKSSLEVKRKIIENQTNRGLYPYCANFLKDVKSRTGEYWSNHFNTIGIIGMNEAIQNFMEGEDITTANGQKFAIEMMNYMRELMMELQEETGHMYNLEATPAEGTSYKLALADKERFPNIITAGTEETPYYTNSTQLPVDYTEDIFEMMELQDELQSLYTGGTVQHLYLGEKITDIEAAKSLIKKSFTNYKMPYISLTPTFSICQSHGYIAGEHFECPECGAKTEVWTRIVGYLRPVQNFNKGKKQEYYERSKLDFDGAVCNCDTLQNIAAEA